MTDHTWSFIPWRGRMALLLALAVVGSGSAPVTGQPAYTLDRDPLRLGNRAFERGRFDDARTRYEESVAAGYRLADAHYGLAQVALRQGRLDDAEIEFERSIAAGGGRTSDALSALGVLLLRRGRPAEARPRLEEAAAADPNNWRAQYGLACLDLAAGNLAQAAQRLERGSRRRGVDAGEDLYQHGRALVLLAGGDPAGAETAALRAMHLNPSDPQHAQLVARIYEQQGVPALAIQAYEQALAAPLAQPTAPLLHQLGNLYRSQNRFNEAHDSYVRAVAVDSAYAPALGDLADLLRRAGRHEPAARTYLRYVAATPVDTTAWLGLAESLHALRRFDQAAQAASQARALDPTSQAALSAFARAAIQGADPDAKAEAAVVLAAVSDTVGLDASLLLALAAWQTEQKQYDAARAALARAAVADSSLYQVPFQQGIVALRTGRTEDAITAFSRAVAREPGSAAINLNLGIALYQAGQLPEAIQALRRAADLDADLVVARLMLAQTLAAMGEITAAENEYSQVLARQPNHAQALRGLGYCRLRQADYAGAERWYGEATAAEPGNADGWAGLGSARLGQDRLDDAAAAFDRARKIDPRNAMLQGGVKLLEQVRNSRKEDESR